MKRFKSSALAIEMEISLAKVWPNPFTDYLNVSLTDVLLRGYFRLYDFTGRIVYESGDLVGMHDISTTNLSSGIYYWEIDRPDGRKIAGKLIKLKE